MTQIQVSKPNVGEEEINAAITILRSGNYVQGKKVAEFEEMFADYIGTDYAIACSNGTAALHMSILATQGEYDLGDIMVPTMSFFSTVSSVMMTENDPVFITVKNDFQINEKEIEERIDEFTKAIIPVHLFGYPCNIKAIMKIAKKYNLKVIEDCAQAHGAEVDGQKVGSFGDCGIFSFYATKNMTTMEGGMVTTNNPEIAEKCKLLRNHGMTDNKTHTILGYNYRMTELQAAIGIEQLKKLDTMNERRIEISRYITNEIVEKYDDYMSLHPLYDVIPENLKCVYFWLPIYSWFPEKFRDYLKSREVGYRCRYDDLLPYQPIFRRKYYSSGERMIKNGNAALKSLTGLPNHPGLTEEEIKRIVKVVIDYPAYLERTILEKGKCLVT